MLPIRYARLYYDVCLRWIPAYFFRRRRNLHKSLAGMYLIAVYLRAVQIFNLGLLGKCPYNSAVRKEEVRVEPSCGYTYDCNERSRTPRNATYSTGFGARRPSYSRFDAAGVLFV